MATRVSLREWGHPEVHGHLLLWTQIGLVSENWRPTTKALLGPRGCAPDCQTERTGQAAPSCLNGHPSPPHPRYHQNLFSLLGSGSLPHTHDSHASPRLPPSRIQGRGAGCCVRSGTPGTGHSARGMKTAAAGPASRRGAGLRLRVCSVINSSPRFSQRCPQFRQAHTQS